MAVKVKGEQYVCKLDMTMSGRKCHKGQIVQPAGAMHDQKVFGDATHWTYRWHGGTEPLLCDTDGCGALFDCEANLQRHRRLAHGPEWDERMQREARARAEAAEREAVGETIGGHEVVKTKTGPHGTKVPYIEYPGA